VAIAVDITAADMATTAIAVPMGITATSIVPTGIMGYRRYGYYGGYRRYGYYGGYRRYGYYGGYRPYRGYWAGRAYRRWR